ncbi:MAG: alpha/beta hydrolase [Xanthobacteraceae bacterium]
MATFFGAMSGLQPPMEEREAADVRALMDGFALKGMPSRPNTVTTQEFVAKLKGRDIKLRLFRPAGAKGALPVMLYFHGGGWVIGNIETHDRYVAMLCESSGCAYVAVDYRLAPEHPYPAAIDDAYESLCWIHDNAAVLNVDPKRIGVSGDSAGGQLSAACTLLAREKGPHLTFQLLIYPLTDCDFERPSYHLWSGLLLTTPYMKWLWKQWVGDTLPVNDPLAVPLRTESLKGLPPAYVVTCEFDILRDEGELYALRLMNDGVPTTLRRVPKSTHPFFRAMHVSPYVQAEMREMGHQIRRHMAP